MARTLILSLPNDRVRNAQSDVSLDDPCILDPPGQLKEMRVNQSARSSARWPVSEGRLSRIWHMLGGIEEVQRQPFATSGIRVRREAIVNAQIKTEAVSHDVAATVAAFRHPRYEVSAFGAIVDGAEAVNELMSGPLAASPESYWAGIDPTGKRMEIQSVLIFVFEGDNLVCEKVYFDHAAVQRQLGAIA